MNSLSIATLLAGLTLVAPLAHADDPELLRGEDALFGVVTDAINQAGLANLLIYVGGGDGSAEAALRSGTQAIAPMSRRFTTATINDLLNQGVTPVENEIGLDGVTLFVQDASALTQIDIPTIRAVYNCSITRWEDVPGSGQTGEIVVYRLDDRSGTTDTLKTLVGITAFGPCATIVATTWDIAFRTATEPNAIGYAALSGHTDGNRALALVSPFTGVPILPVEATIRDFSYPLARRLFISQATEARVPSDAEQQLLDAMLDRSFLDPILLANQFVTCPPVEDGGCP